MSTKKNLIIVNDSAKQCGAQIYLFIYLHRVIENDLDNPWMITRNISPPLQLETINIIVSFPPYFCHPWMTQK
jgi:hypothetical protein